MPLLYFRRVLDLLLSARLRRPISEAPQSGRKAACKAQRRLAPAVESWLAPQWYRRGGMAWEPSAAGCCIFALDVNELSWHTTCDVRTWLCSATLDGSQSLLYPDACSGVHNSQDRKDRQIKACS